MPDRCYHMVWVVTPNQIDAQLATEFLGERGIAARALGSLTDLAGELPGGAGCIVLAEEALVESELAHLGDTLATQPPWSDLPLILIAGDIGSLEKTVERAFPHSGIITLLERPLNPMTLVSAVKVGLRSRIRQLEVRDLLAQREDALNQRDEFLAMLAHELRNPLAPIRNAVYLQRKLEIDHPMFVKTREIVDKQVTHLTRMLDDLLDVARLERGKVTLQMQRLDINSLVAAAMETCSVVAQTRGHKVQVKLAGEPLPVDADPVRVDQIICNLLSNALKFTPDSGEIQLESGRIGDWVTITVRDNGIGLRPEMLRAIFEPFRQGEQTLARAPGGLGMGLTISRRLAEMHGGAIEVSSEGENKGSTFTLRLPLAKGVRAETAAVQPARHAMARRRVLIVEDNPDIRESLRLILDMWGHEVLIASGGREGIDLAETAQPDVALIDIGLPGVSGYEVATAIRANWSPAVRNTKLVAVTGYGQRADRDRAMQSGFDAHLLKPVDLYALEKLLAEETPPRAAIPPKAQQTPGLSAS